MNALDGLTETLAKLPGLGKKSANRLAYHILESSPSYAKNLAASLSKLHESVKPCSICGCWTEADPCPVCSDPNRDKTILCVVERAQDVRVIEKSREFQGVFYVLGGLISPLEGVRPENLRIGGLVYRVKNENIREVILALNPTFEGDTTALYLQKTLHGCGAQITRLASGLPVGGDLEYTDNLTLARSFRSRTEMN
ncbi:MAG: recombination mediator RecR [Spirochaetaceae bacterium]|jgi:recombination protein RecR|nr:recombination mediator RecR [Spirochaetaceae bacterium]